MQLESRAFGTIDYEEKDLIYFEEGLYGFEEIKRFIFIESDDEAFHFHWLQSVENPDLSFVVTFPFLFVEEYEFDLSEDVLVDLSIEKPEDMTILSIVRVGDDVSKTSINLQAPIIIRNKTKKAKQVILDEKFSHRYFIFETELNKGEK